MAVDDDLVSEEISDQLDEIDRAARYAGSRVGTVPDPQCRWDSEAESAFGKALFKYLRAGVEFVPGTRVATSICPFRPDVLLRYDGRAVDIEVDGREFHKDWVRDLLRDAALLASTNVQAIYRMTAANTCYRPFDCLFSLAVFERKMFDARARDLIGKQASELARCKQCYGDAGFDPTNAYRSFDDDVEFDRPLDEEEGNRSPNPVIARRTASTDQVARTIKWLHETQARHKGLTFDVLVERLRKAIHKSND